jgi:hypothetical protein
MSSFFYIVIKNVLHQIDPTIPAYDFYVKHNTETSQPQNPGIFSNKKWMIVDHTSTAPREPASLAHRFTGFVHGSHRCQLARNGRSGDLHPTNKKIVKLSLGDKDPECCLRWDFAELFHLMYQSNLPSAAESNNTTSRYDFMMLNTILMEISKLYQTSCHCEISFMKFAFLSKLCANPFLQTYHATFLDIFHVNYKIYQGFNRLARIVKLRKARIYNTEDLISNAFSQDQIHAGRMHPRKMPKNVFMLLQNGFLYCFSRVDLIRTWMLALGHAPYNFASPLPFKNPYNKIALNTADLYNIYFFLCDGHIQIPNLIHYFYSTHFCLKKFKKKYEYKIRECSIKQFVTNAHDEDEELYTNTLDMLDEYLEEIQIDAEFPRKQLAQIMRPYLFLYLCIQADCNVKKYKRQLEARLQDLYAHNHAFGRRMLHKPQLTLGNTADKVFNVVTFIDSHPPFQMKDIDMAD